MALIDMKERATESDAYRFRTAGAGIIVIVGVSRAAAQQAGGFAANRARFAAIASEKHARGDLEPNGTVFIETADL